MFRSIFFFCIIFSRTIIVNAQISERSFDTLEANNCAMWVSNNGMEAHNALTDSAGFIWPKDGGSLKHTIYLSGLLLGGKKGSDLSIGGIYYNKSSYSSGLYGKSQVMNDSLGRIWHIKKDWENLPEGKNKEYYKFCYYNWPADIGAPFIDKNNNGVFERGIDEPDFIGDEVIFYTAYNSPDADLLYGDDSIHSVIQINVTLWAYDTSNYLQDAIFEKIEMINKSPDTLEDFYAAYWVDADLGYAMDDYVGCDSSLFMGYAWNSFVDDPFYGEVAPAAGHVVLSGFRKGNENLMMSAFGPNFKVSETSFDPRNAQEHYNVIRGLLTTGDSIINPYNNTPTNFPLSGDPESLSGWYEGAHWPAGVTFNHPPYPGDRRYYICTGPVEFAPGDTQSITFAHVVALGTSNRNSITLLKQKAYNIHRFYGNDFITSANEEKNIPEKFYLSQNYPNPFNPSTIIEYSVDIPGYVKIEVYNSLGQKISELVNEYKNKGNYKVKFNASNLSSGIYYYRLYSGKRSMVKKMLLIK